ncbi:nuclease-related domain-containing protein [Xanthomonas hortorum]|uniref:nuclease-related domain-containing protein n=1 Tax=Xanthomonas hortorum TaxID=56454 RepID=UPI0015936CE3|nr:nuclease-related domain-containing protein [Xanthomonas hortorum]NHF68003.1 preprotein translocase [Xanthomonas hortorum]
MIKPLRSEAEVFADLEILAQSPGYVHAIAQICFRDNFVTYVSDMKASDLQKLFSHDRLIRTEITTVLGLLARCPIDTTLPTPEVLREYLARTDILLEELHDAMRAPMMEVVKAAIEQRDGNADVWRGEAMREPIFYGTESAYQFQYRDLAVEKYHADDAWLLQHKGFSIAEARTIAEAMCALLVEKMTRLYSEMKHSDNPPETWLPAFTQSQDEIGQLVEVPAERISAFFAAFTMCGDNAKFQSVGDFNSLAEAPLLAIDGERVLLFQSYSIYEALCDSPFYWMMADASYRPTAAKHRGVFTETFAARRLERVFGAEHVIRGVNLVRSKGEIVGEVDVLVMFGDRLIVVQAKSKKLTLEARRGNDGQLRKDFAGAIQDSYDQAHLCADTILSGKCKLIGSDGTEVLLPQTPKEIFIFNVVSDHYPALTFQTRQYLKYRETAQIRAPFVMDVFLLDALTEMLESPLRLLSYVRHRVENTERLAMSHELTALGFHLKRNLWIEPEFNMIMLEDDIAIDLDLAMMVRRDNVQGPHTPDGILTRFAGTQFERLLQQIEKDPAPVSIELGLMLLTLDEDFCRTINQGLQFITRQTKADEKVHDFTIGGKEGGITFHCNIEPSDDAKDKLGAYCTCRKYAERAQRWIGVSLDHESRLQFGVALDYDWQQSDDMDAATAGMRRPMSPASLMRVTDGRQSKVGRNDPCTCGSGKKFKKCCIDRL